MSKGLDTSNIIPHFFLALIVLNLIRVYDWSYGIKDDLVMFR